MAKQTIEGMHPLNSAPLGEVFPIFKPCSKMNKKKVDSPPLETLLKLNESRNRRTSTLAYQRKVDKKSQEKQQDDPFNFLGFGLVAYRDLMFAMIVLFSILSLLMAPAMYIYSRYDSVDSGLARYSIGNIGYSSSKC